VSVLDSGNVVAVPHQEADVGPLDFGEQSVSVSATCGKGLILYDVFAGTGCLDAEATMPFTFGAYNRNLYVVVA
jgi:hypothetical protein